MTDIEKITLFLSIFRGRTDVYARHWESGEKSGYSPAYQFDWNEFYAHKAKGGNLHTFKNKTLKPLTKSVIKSHLTGKETIGIYPLLKDNKSYFIAADFDGENWIFECRQFIDNCTKYSLPVYLERSRSGNGGHVWLFFEDSYPAFKSRKILFEILRKTFNISFFEREISFDRLFPNQDYHSNLGFGNLIALPLNGEKINEGNTCFINPDTLEAYDNQLDILINIKKIAIKKLDEVYEKLVENFHIPESNEKNDQKIKIVLANQIYLNKDSLNAKMTVFIRDKLNFLNSEYVIKKRIGKSVYKTEKYYNAITEMAEKIILPRGFLDDFITFCRENNFEYTIKNRRQKLPEIKIDSKITLYDYQEEVLRKTETNDSGVIVAPPGTGKTVMGLNIVSRKKQNTLIIVHRKQLLDQWVERIQSFLEIPKKKIGQISGSKKKIGEHITVAMIQSLAKLPGDSELFDRFGLIIVDECHHVPAKIFRSTIVKFQSYYMYGLTATPKRKHNDENLIFIYIGNIISEIKPFDVAGDGTKKIYIKNTSLSVPFDYRIDEYSILSKILIFDTSRNRQIIADITEQITEGKKGLVLTERKEHIEVLYLYLKDTYEIITVSGDDSAASQKTKIAQLKEGHYQLIISTGQFFGEGIDICDLDSLFLVYPFSFEGKLIQYIGRIERSKGEKVIYDYRDIKIDYFEKFYKNRKRYYKRQQKQGLFVMEEE